MKGNMKSTLLISMLGVSLLSALAMLVRLSAQEQRPQPDSFTTIDFPGATFTEAWGINPQGDIVGLYRLADQKTHGFLLSRDGNFTAIDFSGATDTEAFGINPQGDIVGDYTLADRTTHAYLLRGGEFTTIDFPEATLTSPGGINPRGEIVGLYRLADNITHGFLLSKDDDEEEGELDPQLGHFTTIDFPGATFSFANGINPRGDIVGPYISAGVSHGYLLSGGQFSTIDFPGATFTNALGINPRGDIVGRYVAGGVSHGYLLTRERERDDDRGGESKFITIDCPGAAFSGASAINPRGDIVGRCTIAGVRHGFLLSKGGRNEDKDDDGPR